MRYKEMPKLLLAGITFVIFIMGPFIIQLRNGGALDFSGLLSNISESIGDTLFELGGELHAVLAIVQTINTLYDSIPKLILEKYYGNTELGVFSAIAYISLAGGLVVTAITTGYATELALLLKKNKYNSVLLLKRDT